MPDNDHSCLFESAGSHISFSFIEHSVKRLILHEAFRNPSSVPFLKLRSSLSACAVRFYFVYSAIRTESSVIVVVTLNEVLSSPYN